ncbi:hypothetical protein DFH29DRAFT_1021511 [Suillus ampliporus]|nr:hypothetical protein DFH29DRAFT_1021511 [Suillus ampliporus]
MTLTIDIVDRLLITRLELNAQATTKHSLADVDSSNASLRGTLKSLQSSLFQIFNTLMCTSPKARQQVLEYFATVELDNVASDSFMVNLQSVLLRFAEPFMDTSDRPGWQPPTHPNETKNGTPEQDPKETMYTIGLYKVALIGR